MADVTGGPVTSDTSPGPTEQTEQTDDEFTDDVVSRLRSLSFDQLSRIVDKGCEAMVRVIRETDADVSRRVERLRLFALGNIAIVSRATTEQILRVARETAADYDRGAFVAAQPTLQSGVVLAFNRRDGVDDAATAPRLHLGFSLTMVDLDADWDARWELRRSIGDLLHGVAPGPGTS